MLKHHLELTERDRMTFNLELQRGKLWKDLNQKSEVICYIDSTWVTDYLVMVETISSPHWFWISPDKRDDTGYHEVRTTLADLLNNLSY